MGCHGGCLTSKRLHKLVLPADSASRGNINISVNSMVKHVEMQKGVHFTIVCAIFLIGFKKALQRSMYMNPYNSLYKTDIPFEEREINMSTFLGYCFQLF